jgi:hypothetical protein
VFYVQLIIFILWEEKNYISQMNNELLQNEKKTENTTNEIRKELNQIACGDTKEKAFYRKCPTCENLISYPYRYQVINANNRGSKCRSCVGKIAQIKNCEKLKDSIKRGDEHHLYGKTVSDETRMRISCAKIGKPSPLRGKPFTDVHRDRISKSNKGKIRSDSYKKYIRERMFSKMGENKKFLPSYNERACEYFDWVNKFYNMNGVHGRNIGEYILKPFNYYLDYYEPNLNIVMEWDEPAHFLNGKLREKDIIRQNNIINKLKCSFYRIRELTDGKITVNCINK